MRASSFSFLLLVLSAVIGSTASQAQSDVTEADLKKIENAINQVQLSINQTSNERSSVFGQLKESEQAIADLVTELASISAQIDNGTTELNNLNLRSQALTTRRDEQQSIIVKYLQSAYMAGSEEYIKLLLNQEDISKSGRNLRFFQYLSEARSQKIREFEQTLEELALVSADITHTTDQLRANRDNLNAQQQQLTDTKSARQDLLDELDIILSQRGQELARLEQDKVEMELLIAELRRSILNLSLGTEQQAFAELKGKLPWPVEGRVMNAFGARHELGDLTWEGINIAGNEGDPVRAVHHGRVVFSEWFNNSGLLLIIDHGDGYMSLYAHNQLLYKEVGEWVTSGETIATVGNTGGKKSNALYFEIRSNGNSLDPVSWFTARN